MNEMGEDGVKTESDANLADVSSVANQVSGNFALNSQHIKQTVATEDPTQPETPLKLTNAIKNELMKDGNIIEQVDLLKEHPLSLSESQDSKITSIEAWDLNLYIGTDKGEIIHMYMLDEESGFIQISKQKLSAASKPVRKIVVLSGISIVLVHYGSTVTGFHLPELSPANIGKAKNVLDIALDYKDLSIDHKTKSTRVITHRYHDQIYSEVILFTSNAIKFLKVFKDSMKLHKELIIQDLRGGLCFGEIMVCSTETGYCLYNAVREQILCTLPLMSDISRDMAPIIRAISSEEVFLVGGGEDKDAPAIGMFISTQGDVTRSTITFSQYPHCVCIEHPFIISSIGNTISVYSIESQKKLQDLQIGSVKFLQLFKCSRIFEIKSPEMEKKITLVPLVSTMDNNEIERIVTEADIAVAKAVCFSSTISADSLGSFIKILKPQSKYDRLIAKSLSAKQTNCESILDELKVELEEVPDDSFVVMLVGIFMIKWNIVDQFPHFWSSHLELLDPRLVIYAFKSNERPFVIYGSVWVYQSFVDCFKKLQGSEKTTGMMKAFYEYLLNCCFHEFEQDNINKLKSVEIALFKVGFLLNKELSSIVNQIKYAKDAVVEELLQTKHYFILSLFYSRLNEPQEFLFYWKGLISGEFLDDEFTKKYDKVEALKYSSEYVLSNCSGDEDVLRSYAEWLFVENPSYAMQFINDTRFVDVSLNDIKLLSTMQQNKSPILMDYLEYIFEVKNEKQFMGDLIICYFNAIKQFLDSHSENTKELEKALSDYIEMKSPKLSLFKYWDFIDTSILTKGKIHLIHKRLYGLLGVVPSGIKSVFEQQSVLYWCKSFSDSIDLKARFPLLYLIILERTASPTEVLNLLICYQDFKSAELYAVNVSLNKIDNEFFSRGESPSNKVDTKIEVSQKHLLEKVFSVYLKNNESELIDEFLFKYDLLSSDIDDKVSTIKRAEQFVGVINKIPDDFPVSRLKRFLVNHLVEISNCDVDLAVKRAVLKLEINRITKLKDLQLNEI